MLLGILNSQAAGGGAGAFDLLETVSLTSSVSSVTFSGLDAYTDYKHLQIRAVPLSGSFDGITFRLNSDSTSANYKAHFLQGDGSTVGSFSADGNAGFRNFGATGNSNTTYAHVIDILDFSNTSKNTTVRALQGAAGSTIDVIVLRSGVYLQTSAISSLNFIHQSSTFIAGSRFSLYGVK